jgi:hypothetical protein
MEKEWLNIINKIKQLFGILNSRANKEKRWIRFAGKGGSAKTPAQQEAQSKVGKEWGPIVGVSNQSQPLKEALSHVMVFSHEEGVEVVVPVCKTAAAVFDYVHNEMVALGKEHLFSKELVKKAKGGGPFYGLIRGKKKKIHGWSIIDRISPSELSD